MRFLLLLLIVFFNTASSLAQELLIKSSATDSGFALHIDIPSGWKVYANTAGNIGKPLEIIANAEVEYKFPEPKSGVEQIGNAELKYYYYDTDFTIQVITEAKTLDLEINYGMCQDVCLNKHAKVHLQKDGVSVFYILLIALFGGMILNLMPCIFPLLGLKLHKIASYHRTAKEPYFIVLGIYISYFFLFIFALSLTLIGKQFEWGMHFQNPFVLITLSLILIGMSLYLLFDFTFPNPFARLAYIQSRSSYINAMLYGTMSVALSTPCTAPLLATALGYALTQSLTLQFLTFISIATGFASPYMLCLVFPKALDFFPHSGKWMLIIKKLLALPLIITAIWFFHASYSQFFISVKEPIDLSIIEDKAKSQIVLVNVTADWCITCKYNNYRVFHTQEFIELIKEDNVYFLQLDYTSQDKNISQLISKHHRSGIPFTILIYNKHHIVLPELLSLSDLKLNIRKLKKQRSQAL